MSEIVTPENVKVGDFVQYTMVTDTSVQEVVKVTDKSITVRPTNTGKPVKVENRDGNPYPCVYAEVLQWVGEGADRTYRFRQDGTFRAYTGAKPFRHVTRIDGVPVTYTDYRM